MHKLKEEKVRTQANVLYLLHVVKQQYIEKSCENDLISQCSSRARGCITVSLVSHEYFTTVFCFVFFKKKAQKHESSSPQLECSTFPEGKLSSVAFIKTSPPSAKHHIPSVLFPPPSHCYNVKWVKFQIMLCGCIQYVDTVCTVY